MTNSHSHATPQSDAEILERLSIRIETLLLRPLYADHLRREIQHLP